MCTKEVIYIKKELLLLLEILKTIQLCENRIICIR